MLELPHTIVGAIIATKIGNPLLVFPLAFLSNFLVDLLPHWNPHVYTEMQQTGKVSRRSTVICLIDSSLALLIGLFLAFRFWPDLEKVTIVLFGCFFAIMADLVEAPYFFLGWKNKYLLKLILFQRRIQWNVPLIPGLASQALFLAFCFFLLFS